MFPRPSSTKSGPSWEKKEEHLSPQEQELGRLGDDWDHVALNPQTKFVVSLICGKRTFSNTRQLLADFKARTDGSLPKLFTSDELSHYKRALLETYGTPTPRQRNGNRGRFPHPLLTPPADLVYATVHKHRRKGRVIRTEPRLIFGTPAQLQAALASSPVSSKVNTAFVERFNGTARHRNSRQVRKTYAFSKDWELHEHQSWLSLFGYNYLWTPRTLSAKDPNGRRIGQSPAMAQGITAHVWTVREFIRYQVVPQRP
jgi:IS1 family transposase